MPFIRNVKIDTIEIMLSKFFFTSDFVTKKTLEDRVDSFTIQVAKNEKIIYYDEKNKIYYITEKGRNLLRQKG